jgi:hypothetical protein
MIDDATNVRYAQFFDGETIAGAMTVLSYWIKLTVYRKPCTATVKTLLGTSGNSCASISLRLWAHFFAQKPRHTLSIATFLGFKLRPNPLRSCLPLVSRGTLMTFWKNIPQVCMLTIYLRSIRHRAILRQETAIILSSVIKLALSLSFCINSTRIRKFL